VKAVRREFVGSDVIANVLGRGCIRDQAAYEHPQVTLTPRDMLVAMQDGSEVGVMTALRLMNH